LTFKQFEVKLISINYQKNKEGIFSLVLVYGRFLSINIASTIATIMISTNKPAIAGTKYRSAADGAGVALAGAVVACASATAKLVSEYEG
jgi:hypothetical protein